MNKEAPNPPAVVTPTRAGYDQWASCYDTDGNPLIALEEPHVDRLLGDVRGCSVLDVGCGTGRHAIRLTAAGATVEALDFSAGMLQQAREKAAAISFRLHDLAEPLPFATGTFDRVVCGLVVDHIADLAGLFGEMLRVCRPSGWVVVSVMHPAMMLRGVQARFHDPKSGQEIRPASRAHQLSDYVMAAVRAGCVLDHLSEHLVSEDLASRLERARRYVGWPMLFMMRLLPVQPCAAISTEHDAALKTASSRSHRSELESRGVLGIDAETNVSPDISPACQHFRAAATQLTAAFSILLRSGRRDFVHGVVSFGM